MCQTRNSLWGVLDVKLELEVGLSFVVRGADFISEIALGLLSGSRAQRVFEKRLIHYAQ